MLQNPKPTTPLLNVRIGSGDLTLETPNEVLLRLDAEGRWCSFRPGALLHRRTLDGKVVVHRGRRIHELASEMADDLHETVAHFARNLVEKIENGVLEVALHGRNVQEKTLQDRLRAAMEWTPARFRLEKDRFADAYPEPVFILPPDRYRDVVLLPALGCPHGRCSFCAFYRGRGFRILESAEFENHLAAVRRFFGGALQARDGIFLGSASALSLSQHKLLQVLDRVNRVMGPQRRSIAAFHDPDHSPQRTPDEYETLLAQGLDFITVGLETGLPKLRNTLGKRGSVDRIIEAVTRQKRAGMHCGVTVLVGAGGVDAAPDHREATIGAICQMPLGSGDQVYLSPLEGSLAPAHLEMEFNRFADALARSIPAKIVPYRIDRYHYFS